MIFLVWLRNLLINVVYTTLMKPILFAMDPEFCHDMFTSFGLFLNSNPVTRKFTSIMFGFEHDSLKQKVHGMHFENPVGLAAGFDKNCLLPQLMKECGFGFEECGSITGEPCEGNPKPRLHRLIQSRSIVVNYGLKNDGAEVISERIAKYGKIGMPLGISIAKTNCKSVVSDEAGIADFVKAHDLTKDLGDYVTVNISCPNAFGGENFSSPDRLDMLLKALKKVKCKKPMYLKMASSLQGKELDEMIDVALKYKLHGVICCNLLKGRDSPLIVEDRDTIPESGGLSGKVVFDVSNEMIRRVYNRTKDVRLPHKFIVIGVGGIFTAEDAYKKIRAGATLLQMITGMIFEGPQVVSEINRGLVELLEKDGFSNISEAIGVDSRE